MSPGVKILIILLVLAAATVAGFFALNQYIYNQKQGAGGEEEIEDYFPQPSYTPQPQVEIPGDVADSLFEKADLIVVSEPVPMSTLSSPLTVKGEARGTWFFEATFPIVLVDWDGRIIAEGYSEAKSDWMTEEFVPFEGTLTFNSPAGEEDFTKRGAIILQKANPSGLPENDDAIEVPIRYN